MTAIARPRASARTRRIRPQPRRRRRRLSDRTWLLIGAIVFLAEIVAVVAIFPVFA